MQQDDKVNPEILQHVVDIAKELASEQNFDKLIHKILNTAITISCADGGSIYVVEDNEQGEACLSFRDSAAGFGVKNIKLAIDSSSIAGHVAKTRKALKLDDVHDLPAENEFHYNPEFDRKLNYFTRSMIVVPLENHHNEVIGVVQLINRKKDCHKAYSAENVIAFSNGDFELVTAVSALAGVSLEKYLLIQEQKALLEGILHVFATAIDTKSPYTGNHCSRVPVIMEMLTEAACMSEKGTLANFDLNEEQKDEVRVAAWLHDCGKIITPVHVMDKATKLEGIMDRLELIRYKLEILKRDAQIHYWKSLAENPESQNQKILQEKMEKKIAVLDSAWELLQTANTGGEFMQDTLINEIHALANFTFSMPEGEESLLSPEELEMLCIRKGTLSEPERIIINKHMVATINMLQNLPLPKNLQNVPEYAGGHHEKLDGSGYPKGIYAGDMSIPARLMVIADVFEALTATDRPYKKGKTLSETMTIMGYMMCDGHLDKELFELFIQSGVYRKYSDEYVPENLRDAVDEQKLLSLQQKPIVLPSKSERDKRWEDFLPEYQERDRENL